MLVAPKRLAKQTTSPRSNHRRPNPAAGDHSKTGHRPGYGRRPVENETTLNPTPSVRLEAGKLPRRSEPAVATKTEPVSRRGAHGGVRPESGACGRCDGGWKGWRGRSWSSCGRGSRADAPGGSSKVDTGVSCVHPVPDRSGAGNGTGLRIHVNAPVKRILCTRFPPQNQPFPRDPRPTISINAF